MNEYICTCGRRHVSPTELGLHVADYGPPHRLAYAPDFKPTVFQPDGPSKSEIQAALASIAEAAQHQQPG